MRKFVISEELAQTVLNYLGTRPFIEVHKFVPDLMALQTLELVPETPEELPVVTPEVVEDASSQG